MYQISDTSFLLILKTLEQFPEIEKTILFGSRAMGTSKSGSDIDLAIFGKNFNLDICTRLSYTLNQILRIPYKVDVIDYSRITNVELKKHIDTFGIIIFENVNRFEQS